MTDKEELIKACDVLTKYCNHGTNCCNCLFDSDDVPECPDYEI